MVASRAGGIGTPRDRSARRRGSLALAGTLITLVLLTTSCSSEGASDRTVDATATTQPAGTTGSGGPSTGTSSRAGPATGATGAGGTTPVGTTTASSVAGGHGTTAGGSNTGAAGSTGTNGPSNPVGSATLPSFQQQFRADDATFRTVLRSVQASVNRLPSAAGTDQLTQAVLPLVAASNLYQSQIVNLPWSPSARPQAQALTERLGQLTAVLAEVAHPSGFQSVAAFRSQLSSAAAAVRSAAGAARRHVPHS